MLDHLIFDTTNAGSMADSANVGAWLRSSDGTLIDKAAIGGVNRLAVDSTLKDGAGNVLTSTAGALDVNIKSPINVNAEVNVDINGIYNASTNSLPSNAGLIGFTRGATPALADQINPITGGAAPADAVVNANVHGMDVNGFLMGYNGTTWDRLHSTSGALNVAVTSDVDVALANTAIVSNTDTLSVAGTAQAAVAAPLANRKYLLIYNFSNQQMYVGGASVTAANGFPVSPGSTLELRAGAASPVNFVGKAAQTPEIRTLELS